MQGFFQAALSVHCPVFFTDNVGDGTTVVREGGSGIDLPSVGATSPP